VTPPTVETERLRLRPFRAGDRDDVYKLFGNPEVASYWAFPAWTELAQADEFLKSCFEPPAGMIPWALADAGTDRLLGTTTIFAMRKDQGRAEIGYSLLREHWGKGLAREAVTRAIVYGFDELELRRFEADIDPRNAPSIGLVERLGFQREGLLRERWLVAGEVCDTVMYGLLRHEFGGTDRALLPRAGQRAVMRSR
jgi:RimJ/RimL family protein N-acetyltransferase